MTPDITEFVSPSCALLGLGEPTHREPAFAWLRNDLFARLAGHGFRSIALETDRVAALTVNDYVRDGAGTLDAAMRDGFSHGLGDRDANRHLVAWMHEYNEGRPADERLTFHGFDAPTEMFSAPSPRRYLAHARDYLGLDADLDGLAGDDERWSRPEAVLDPAVSVGATAEAGRLRAIADDMLVALYARAPELIAATSRAGWFQAAAHLTGGIGLLRYHREAARPGDRDARIASLSAVRDALMAQNLLDLRIAEAGRGPTLVFAHNLHLQRGRSGCAGGIVGSLVGGQYTFVAGSLGRGDALDLGDPAPDTYEGVLGARFPTWGLIAAAAVAPARTRTDTIPRQGYFPLDRAMLDGADAVLHIAAGHTESP